jgi:hypothetical protein
VTGIKTTLGPEDWFRVVIEQRIEPAFKPQGLDFVTTAVNQIDTSPQLIQGDHARGGAIPTGIEVSATRHHPWICTGSFTQLADPIGIQQIQANPPRRLRLTRR